MNAGGGTCLMRPDSAAYSDIMCHDGAYSDMRRDGADSYIMHPDDSDITSPDGADSDMRPDDSDIMRPVDIAVYSTAVIGIVMLCMMSILLAGPVTRTPTPSTHIAIPTAVRCAMFKCLAGCSKYQVDVNGCQRGCRCATPTATLT